MATSTFASQLVFADSRRVRVHWVIAALLVIVALVGGQLIGVTPASAAGGFTVTLRDDGTGQGTSAGCHITGPGGDNTPSDGVVCTQDTVTYRWGFDIPSNETVTVTMRQELPEGLMWQPNNTTACLAGDLYSGTGTITNNGRTLECEITFQPQLGSRSGYFDMFAFVQPNVPDGTVMNSTFTYKEGNTTVPLPVAPVTVRSDLQVNLIKQMRQDYDRIRVNVSGAQVGWENPKGIASMDSPFTFVDDLAGMPPSTYLAVNNGDCRLEPLAGFPSTGAASGTWFCTQAGPGQPVYITVTGADTSGWGSAVQAEPNSRTVFAGDFQLVVPQADIPAGGLTVENKLAAFAPTAGNGTMQNFDGNWEPGGGPYPGGPPCTPTNDNCASLTITPYGPGGNPQLFKTINSPGTQYRDSVGNVVYMPGQTFTTKITYSTGTQAQANELICEKFDPTKQQLTGVPNLIHTGGTDPIPAYTIEYGVAPLVNGAGNSVETARCGSPGDPTTDGPWFSSIAAAGGVANISSVRIVFSAPIQNTTFDALIPMINVSQNPGEVVVDYLGSQSDLKSWGNDSAAQYAVTLNILTVDKRSNNQASSDAVRNEIVPFTIRPTLSAAGSVPTVLTVTDPLDKCYLDPTIDPATLANWTVVITPADPGPDGIVCSGDDVSGAILTFTSSTALNPNNPVPAIDYTIRVSPASLDNSGHTNTATVSAQGNIQAESERRSTQFLAVRGAGLIDLVKFVDAPRVQVAPDPIGFSAQWSNLLSSDAGRTQWIDKLPYNGDPRGTSFTGTLQLATLTVLGQSNDVTIEYTSRTPGSVVDDPADGSNQPAGSTVWCEASAFGNPGCPANIGQTTAIRITVGNLNAGRQGGIHFTMQPSGNSAGDVYENYVGVGRSTFPNPIPQSNQVRVDVVSSSVGDTVWWDLDRNGTIEPGENGIPGVTVRLFDSGGNQLATTVTDGNGYYLFDNLRSGDYRVEIDGTTLPYPSNIIPTYDFDGGTTSPNGNSGVFPLGVDEHRTDIDFGYDLPTQIDGTPFIETTVSQLSAAPGASVTDVVRFTNVTAGVYTWTIYGPVAPVTPGTCVGIDWSTATSLASADISVPAGDTTRTTPPVQLSGVGCYTYSGSFAVSSVPGTVLTHPRGLTNETVLVSAGTPTVATVAVTSGNRPGATVSDNVTITGLTENSTYTWTLWGPLAPIGNSCDTVDWSGTPPLAFTNSFAVTPGQTNYNTGDRTVTAVGCYTYSGELAATATSNSVPSARGQQIESFRISANAPTIATVASTLTAGPNDVVRDNFTVTNLGSQSATYSWTLVGPMPSIAGSCAAVDWSQAVPFDFGSQIIPGDGVYQTGPSTLGNAGCYSYTGSIAATATSDPVTQAAGHPDETILVTAVTPDVETEISARAAAAGATVTDLVRVEGLLDPTTYYWALLGPVAAVGNNCPTDPAAYAGADIVDDGTITIPADGEHPTPPVTLPTTGCFTYIGTLAANGKSNAVPLAAGVPEETVLASATTPSITTTASTNVSAPLATITDSVTVSGLGTQNVNYTWVLYGPVDPVTPGTCAGIDWSTAPPFATNIVPITGDGPFSTQPVVLGDAGCYTYTGALPATATTDAFTTARGIPAETVRVDATTPTITTRASANVVLSGTGVSDSVTISGLGNQASTYIWSLLGPLPAVGGQCDNLNWGPVMATPFATDSFPVNGDNVYTTPTTVVTDVGCYTYVGTLAATGTTSVSTQAPGVPDETLRVDPRDPQIVTQASSNTANPGVVLRDSVQISGLNGETATYSWTLVGPVAPVTAGTCLGVDWSTGLIRDSDSFPISGNGTYLTGPTTLTDAGCYSYTGTLEATSTSLRKVLDAGVPAETVLVAANTPQIVTDASPNTGAPGVVVSDSVEITGLGTQASVYRWTLMGPMPTVTAGTCDGIDWSTALVYDSGFFPVAGDGIYETDDTNLDDVGCYSYTSDLDATGSSSRFVQGAGVPEETVRVDANAPSVTTAISDQSVISGAEVRDAVTVTGLAGATTTYHWTLLGPVAAVAGSCPTDPGAWAGALTVQAGDEPVVGDGMFMTPYVTVLAAGCYTYTGLLDATATSSSVTLAAGDPLETTLVEPATPTVSTTVSSFTGALGSSVTDHVVITGPVASGTVYSWRLYGPLPAVAGNCPTDFSTATVFANGTIVTTGATDYDTPPTTLTAVGCFSYGGTLAASASSTEVTQAPGLPAETVRIAPDLPSVSTVADDGSGRPGATVSDTVTIGGMGNSVADYTWNLLGPLPIPAGGCAAITDWSGAATLFTGTLTGIGNGTHATPDRTIADVGCYTYTGTLAGSGTTSSVTLPAGDINETFAIEPFTPAVTTVASPAAQPGGSTTDAVTVSGGGGASALYSWTLVFAAPDGSGDCDAVDWVADGTVVAFGSYTISADGTTTTAPTTVNDAGCYSYTGELAATATSDAVVLPAGDPDETFLLAPFEPSVTTQASINDGLPGDVIADTIEVTNFGLTAARYDWTLLGPVPAVAGSCDTVVWTGAPVLDLGFFMVNPGTSSYQTSDTTLPLPGCYSYTGDLAATTSSTAVTLDAGDPLETALVVALDPTASTLISSTAVYVGDTVRDQIFLGNTRGATPVITWELVGPKAPVAGSCDTVDWTGAAVLYTGTLTTMGDGTYDTPLVAIAAEGCYSYVTIIAATATTNAVTLVAGDPDETVRVSVRPAGLASTGSAIQVGVLIGAGLVLALGLIALAFGRRRNRAKHSATS